MNRFFTLLWILSSGLSGTKIALIDAFAMKLASSEHSRSSTFLCSTPSRQPRRNLVKRSKGRRRQGKSVERSSPTSTEDDTFWETAESRPLLSARSKELGQDYWVDQQALEKHVQIEEARRLMRENAQQVGQIPDEKLWTEVLSPYKQNWIGFISVFFVVIAVIVKEFPELLNYPVISLPDL